MSVLSVAGKIAWLLAKRPLSKVEISDIMPKEKDEVLFKALGMLTLEGLVDVSKTDYVNAIKSLKAMRRGKIVYPPHARYRLTKRAKILTKSVGIFKA